MKNIYLIYVTFFVILNACSSRSVKEKINQAGDVTGQAVGEFASGVSSGMGKAFDVKVSLSENLKDKGISFGKTTVSSDSGATDNLLTAYLIFEKDFNESLTAKAFDSKGAEMGRVTINAAGKKGDAKYFEFHFDKRTNIDYDSKLTIE